MIVRAPKKDRYDVPAMREAWPAWGADRWGKPRLLPGEAYSVTTVLKAYADGGNEGLLHWASKLERAATIRAAVDVVARHKWSETDVTPADLEAEIAARLGSGKAFQDHRQQAADIGTEAHGAIEQRMRARLGLEHRLPKLSGPVAIVVGAFTEWAQRVDLRPISPEQAVYSAGLRTAGTMDLLGEMSGEPALVKGRITCAFDWKSGTLQRSHRIQGAVYAHCAHEMELSETVPYAVVVRFPKTIEALEKLPSSRPFEMEIVPPDDVPDLVDRFRDCLRLHAWGKEA